jgi:cytochrome c-type biogenesis protein CcmE
MLAVFLVYTAIAGGTPQVKPSQLKGHKGEVTLVGKVHGRVTGDARRQGLRFRLHDVKGSAQGVAVSYKGSVPEMFRTGRDVSLRGRLQGATFVGVPGTLVTKCPSKYTPAKKT